MGSLSDTYENAMLDSILGDDHSARFPATVYLALFTTMPTDSTGGVEVVGGSYARVAVTNDSAEWPDAAGGVKTNGNDITFPAPTANWGNVVGWALMDDNVAAGTAHQVAWGELTAPTAVPNGAPAVKFPAGSLSISGD